MISTIFKPMFRNYFITAWRNLSKNRFYSAINIMGLAIGLAVGILILLWVQDELSYDKFHSKADEIYKVNTHIGSGVNEQVWEGSPSPIALFSKKQIPEIANSARIADNYDHSLFIYNNKRFVARNLAYADPSFFTIFDFKLIKGDRNKPFDDSHSVILTSSVAKKYFGEEDPLGKIIVTDTKENFRVTGVLADFPRNSSISYDMIFPMQLRAEKFRGNGDWKTIDDDLGNFVYNIYLQLNPGASTTTVEKKLSDLYQEKRGTDKNGCYFTMQSLKDRHLYARDGNGRAMQIVRIFLVVGIFILAIACINYVNLSTARSIIRSKEVSVRKIIGARKQQLFVQFIIESALIFILSTLLAFGIIQLLLPLYNEVSGKELVLDLTDKKIWLVTGISILGSLVAASIYPALLLSSFKPVEALKGKLAAGLGNAGFRKTLVVTQFVFSVALIISTTIIGLQLKYMREKDLGYNKEHVFSFNARDGIVNHYDAVRTDLLMSPGILAVSSAGNHIVGTNSTTGDTDWKGKEAGRTFLVHPYSVDKEFIPLFNMNMAEGNNFTGSKSDSAHVILNETALAETGIKDPIGKEFVLWDTKATIIGVVKDFNYESLKQKVEPVIFYYQPSNWKIFIRTNGKDAEKALAATKAVWEKYSPGYPFEYSFVDEDYDNLFKSEQQTGTLFNVFAIVAITISCLGLFGLATYTAQVKRKEIGIRKVLGASIVNIARLLTKEFLLLVFISLLISIPVSWWAMSEWLKDFAYSIDINWWVFALAGIISMLIAVLTVSFQAIRAAIANPVNSLKEE